MLVTPGAMPQAFIGYLGFQHILGLNFSWEWTEEHEQHVLYHIIEANIFHIHILLWHLLKIIYARMTPVIISSLFNIFL